MRVSRWAYDQAVDMLLKAYKSPDGSIAAALMYQSGRAALPSALADALHMLATMLQGASVSIRCAPAIWGRLLESQKTPRFLQAEL